MELLKVMEEYYKITGSFPGNEFWSERFKTAFDAEKDKQKEKKYHWYAMSFIGTTENGHELTTTLIHVSKTKNVKLSDINSAASKITTSTNNAMIGCSYLGHMTPEKFEGKNED